MKDIQNLFEENQIAWEAYGFHFPHHHVFYQDGKLFLLWPDGRRRVPLDTEQLMKLYTLTVVSVAEFHVMLKAERKSTEKP